VQERASLIARIRHIRRVRAESEKASTERGAAPIDGLAEAVRVDAMEQRLAHLEQLVEGLQDSVHRASARQDKAIAELQAQIHPAAMGAALDKDARDRGL
jgi:uncharacterized coiled-coil protein SlyX